MSINWDKVTCTEVVEAVYPFADGSAEIVYFGIDHGAGRDVGVETVIDTATGELISFTMIDGLYR